jgi:hypothetical protein
MHPYLIEQLARQRARELRMLAGHGRQRRTRPGPRTTVRHRAGWTLVAIGLRLAGTSYGS